MSYVICGGWLLLVQGTGIQCILAMVSA